jgi:hypothetical protein
MSPLSIAEILSVMLVVGMSAATIAAAVLLLGDIIPSVVKVFPVKKIDDRATGH